MGKWTRRSLIAAGVVAGGALVVGVAIRPGHRAPKVRDLVAGEDEALVNIWVKIAPDNTVTAIVPHAEMGQGVHSTLAQMLAEELDADWDSVQVEEAPAHEEYANYHLAKGFLFGDADVPRALVGTIDGAFLKITQALDLQITGGSFSIRTTGQHGMRIAGAAAREVLAKAAAAAWDVSADDLDLRDSRIRHESSGREATYGEIAPLAAQIAPSSKPSLKDPSEYRLIGASVPRLDIPPKVNGQAMFGIDAELSAGQREGEPLARNVPGLKVATVQACPVFEGTVGAVDDARALALPGVEQVVNLGDAVAVVADGYWHASQGLKALDVQWDCDAHGGVDQQSIFAQFEKDLDRAEAPDAETSMDVEEGDLDAALASAATRIEAEYRVPFLAHAAMEPLNCTVWLRDGVCDVWTGTQNPLGVRGAVAGALEIEPANVTVHNAYLGGAFGRRSVNDYAVQAARVAKAANAPVKLIWSREEDIAQDRYRPAVTSRFRGGLDAEGRPVAWQNIYVEKHEPAEAPLLPYAIANQRIEAVSSPTHVPFGVWRSVDHSQHAFFTESFIDELAAAAGQDGYTFRRNLLGAAPRHRKVLEAAAERAGWGTPLGENRGRGIAVHESFGSIVAQVAEVTVADAKVRVDRVVCAADAGLAVNPDGFAAQMESGIVYALSAVLHGAITIEEGRVKQSNFHDYPVLRIDEMPQIETVIVNSGEAMGGAGEPGTPPLAPAVANAVYAATGQRARELPLRLA